MELTRMRELAKSELGKVGQRQLRLSYSNKVKGLLDVYNNPKTISYEREPARLKLVAHGNAFAAVLEARRKFVSAVVEDELSEWPQEASVKKLVRETMAKQARCMAVMYAFQELYPIPTKHLDEFNAIAKEAVGDPEAARKVYVGGTKKDWQAVLAHMEETTDGLVRFAQAAQRAGEKMLIPANAPSDSAITHADFVQNTIHRRMEMTLPQSAKTQLKKLNDALSAAEKIFLEEHYRKVGGKP
jgi:hypothetical protein